MATYEVCCPLPGTFYRKPSPDAASYVDEGNTVNSTSTIGLIEVMKQYSELTAEQDGVLTQFMVEDGEPVEPGQIIALITY